MTAAEATRASSPGRQVWSLSVQAYRALGEMGLIPDKTKLLYGQVFQKLAKSPIHRLICMRLFEQMRRVLPSGLHVQQEQPITCNDSEPEPNLSVIRGSIEDFCTAHPTTAEIVVEVCVTSHDYDRSKLHAYASAAVKEVWLVLAPEKQIEVHRLPSEAQFRERTVHGPAGQFTSTVLPDFQVELDALFG